MTEKMVEKGPFRLGEYVVDPIGGQLRCGEESTQLQPKVMQLLVCLAANHGQIVSKEFLLENVWSGVFVVDGALRRCIFLLRKALGDEGANSRYLQTVARRGYRLLVEPQPVAQDGARTPTPAALRPASAYRGLGVYEPSHADIFFGRAAAVSQVCSALDKQVDAGRAFVLILGPSGSGKSSLARAGVLPELARSVSERDGVAPHTLIFQVSHGPADPLRYLAQRMVESLSSATPESAAVDALTRLLNDDEDAALAWLREQLAADTDRPARRLLLVVDQFEELFSLDGVSDAVRDRVVAVLYTLARSGTVAVVATMRSEFYPQFMLNETLRFLKGAHGQVDLQFPGAADIAEIVRRPAGLAGLTFDTDEHGRPLDQVLIEDASRHPGSLPLLQFALRELEMTAGESNVLRHVDYRRLGSLEGSLSEHAERVYGGLSDAAKAALPTVLERLVVADPRNAGRVLKRSAALSELDDHAASLELVSAFVEARLITSFLDKSSHVPAVQFVHEAVLIHWQRASDWVQTNYADIRFRSWLAELATRWNDDGRAAHYLLRDGKPLVEATRLAAKPNALEPVAMEFVSASDRKASQRGAIRSVITVAMVVLTIASLAMWQRAVINGDKAQRATLRAEAIISFLVSMFEGADPGNTDGRILNANELLDRARARVSGSMQDEPESRAALLRALGETYLLMGQYDVSDELLASAEAMLPSFQRANPRLASQVLLEIGGLRSDQYRLDEGLVYIERALVQARRADDKYLLAFCLDVRGLIELKQRQFEVARASFMDSMATLDTVTAPTLDVVKLRADLYNNLGIVALEMRRLDEAGEALASAVAVRREHGLDRTASHSTLLTNLGLLRRREGRAEEAVEYFNEALALRTRLHGADHPNNIMVYANMVPALLKLGRYDEALAAASEGVAIAGGDNSGPQAAAVEVLTLKRLVAIWMAGRVAPQEVQRAASDMLPALAARFGEKHAVIAESRAAIIGARIDALAADDALGREQLCNELVALDNELGDYAGNTAITAQRMAVYFDEGGDCLQSLAHN